MRNLSALVLSILISASLFSCNNSASDPNNTNSRIGYDSLSEAGDTLTQHAGAFSTAIHHVVNDINQIPVTGNADRDFAILLKSHYQGEVDLAQAELKNGKDDALKRMAKHISGVQKNEITSLEHFLDSVKKGPLSVSSDKNNKDTGFGKVIATLKSMMWDMSKMDTAMVADKQFVVVMIPHLQSAVYLSEGYLKFGKDALLTQKATEIIPRKKKQIEELRKWMNANKAIR